MNFIFGKAYYPYFFTLIITTFSKFLSLLFPYFSGDGHLKACVPVSYIYHIILLWRTLVSSFMNINQKCVEVMLRKWIVSILHYTWRHAQIQKIPPGLDTFVFSHQCISQRAVGTSLKELLEGGVVPVFLRKPIATCDFSGGGGGGARYPSPCSGSAHGLTSNQYTLPPLILLGGV